MQQRLCDALGSLSLNGNLPPQASMMIAGMVKHLRRSPIPDAEIVASLAWLRNLIDIIDPINTVEVPERVE